MTDHSPDHIDQRSRDLSEIAARDVTIAELRAQLTEQAATVTCADTGPHPPHLPDCPGRDLEGRLPPEYRCDPSAVSGCKGHLPVVAEASDE